MEQTSCARCASSFDRAHLNMCPICHKLVCEGCRVNRSGRFFCSQFCADEFFFGDEE